MKAAPIVDAHAAFNHRLAHLQDREAFVGTGSLLLQDPRDLANRVRQIADMASVEDQPSPVTWATIGALALAGWVGADRSEEMRVDTGDAA